MINGMRIKHEIKEKFGEQVIYIYIDIDENVEFGKDFFNFKKDKIKKNDDTFIGSVKEYAKNNLEDKKGMSAVILINGAIIGSLAVMSLLLPLKDIEGDMLYLTPKYKVEEKVEDDKKDDEIATTNINEEINKEENNKEKEEETQNIEPSTESIVDKSSENNKNPVQNSNGNQNVNNNNNNNNNNNSTAKPEAPKEEQIQGTIVRVRLSNGQIISVGLEEYIVGVVSSEMPASFSNEALKAQAVAARTYALKKVESGKVLSATTEDQVYKTKDELKAMWGGEYDKYYNKVKNAVLSTEGLALTYGGLYIDALYYSTSNGKSEDPIYVWSYTTPYLKPVNSSWDVNTTAYKRTVNITYTTMTSKLGVTVNSGTEIKILSRTTGDRVDKISIGGKVFTGNQVRQLLGLRSTDFDIDLSGGSANITTRGYGHGVGMSQYGANEMAKQGYTYTQILKHYYTGVSIIKR